jgi:hypothetical protein
VASSDPAASAPEDKFADEVVAIVRELTGAHATKMARFELEVTDAAASQVTTLQLGTIYGEVSRASGEERVERLRRFVQLTSPWAYAPAWEKARRRVRPAVRPISSVSASSQAGTSLVRRSLVPFLKLCFAIDFDHAMAYVSGRHLSRWQVDVETLEDAARENLRREGSPSRAQARSPPSSARRVTCRPGWRCPTPFQTWSTEGDHGSSPSHLVATSYG